MDDTEAGPGARGRCDVSHDVSRETLTRYLDEELSADERRTVEAHLSRCTECRREVTMHEKIKEGLAEASGVSTTQDAGEGEGVAVYPVTLGSFARGGR